jgi:putative aminopeptidase FrvX
MDAKSREFFEQLLTSPSPSGFEQKVQHLVHRRCREFVEYAEPDLHGNLILGINTKAERRVLLASHCDQIGFLIKHIDADGFLIVESLGGEDDGVLPGSQVVVHGGQKDVPGVFAKRASHLQSKSEREHVPLLKDMWIDIGAKDRADAQKLVQIGNPISFRLKATPLLNNLICAAGLDNKAGLFVALEVLRLCAKERLDIALYVASTVQEEVGLRGAATASAALQPHVGLAIDVTIATDDPGAKKDSVPCRLGGGPNISQGPNTNPYLSRLLRDAAHRADIRFQPAPTGELEGNDSKAIQVAGAGVATASVGIPTRNMHTPTEVCSLEDIEGAIRVVATFVQSLRSQIDFRPFYTELSRE